MSPVFRTTTALAALATAIAVVARILVPFDHGIWLIAYLVLVGTIAQYLLARGQTVLDPDASDSRQALEASLWGFGVITVPLGIFIDVRILVIIGSITLLEALYLFWQTTRAARDQRPRERSGLVWPGYLFLLAFMAVSVLIGVALSSDVPWI